MDFDFIPETESGLNEFLDKIEDEGNPSQAQITAWDKALRLYKSGQAEAPTTGDADYAQFRTNIIRPTARRKGAILTENKPEIEILPLANGFTKTAEALTSVIRAGIGRAHV